MKFGGFLAGIAMVVAGIRIIYSPTYIEPVFGGLVDFNGYNLPFGIAFIVFGAYWIWIGLTPK
jgi:hypothetical protein